MKSICRSGGAPGSDIAWGNVAKEQGHDVVHYSFEGHATMAAPEDVVILSYEDLKMGNDALLKANENLKRRVPIDGSPVKKLLQRNWWQVRDVDAVYAISRIKGGMVLGGTAWAVQMFLDRHDSNPSNCYVFDLISGQWMKPNSRYGDWFALPGGPCRPEDGWRYAGVGTREPGPVGIAAIRDVFI